MASKLWSADGVFDWVAPERCDLHKQKAAPMKIGLSVALMINREQ